MNSNQPAFMPPPPPQVRAPLLSLVGRDCTVKCQGFERLQNKCDSSSQGQVYQSMGGKTIIFLFFNHHFSIKIAMYML